MNSEKQAPVPLTDTEREVLLCLAGQMIPESAEYGVPGADDPLIFSDILRSLERDHAQLQEALHVVNEVAGGDITSLEQDELEQKLAAFRAAYPVLAGVIEAAVARCYYRDDRVMASIGMEARPPFPEGYEVEQGDWSLLDPVRARGKIYRDVG